MFSLVDKIALVTGAGHLTPERRRAAPKDTSRYLLAVAKLSG